ncbi:MAG: hypothetical protein U1F43_11215 [Myxococcota bacterium]
MRLRDVSFIDNQAAGGTGGNASLGGGGGGGGGGLGSAVFNDGQLCNLGGLELSGNTTVGGFGGAAAAPVEAGRGR